MIKILNLFNNKQYIKKIEVLFFNAINYIIPALILIIVTPILINNLGVKDYSIWIILLTIMSLTGVIQYGINDSTTKHISEDINDRKKVQEFVMNSLIINLTFGFIIGLITFTFALNTDVFMESTDLNYLNKIKYVFVIASFIFIFIFLNQFAISVLKGVSNFKLISKINIFSSLIKNICIIIIALFTNSIVCVVLGLLMTTFIESLVYFSSIKKRLNIKKTKLNFKISIKILKYAYVVWFQNLAESLYSQFDKFVVLAVLGSNQLSVYSISIQLSSQIELFIKALFSYVFPKFSNMNYYKKENSEIKKYFMINLFLQCVILLIFLAFSYFGIELFLNIWIGNELGKEINQYIMWFLISYAIKSLVILPNYFFNAINKQNINLFYNLVIYGFYAILMYLLINVLGYEGLIFAKVLIIFPILIYFYRLFKFLNK